MEPSYAARGPRWLPRAERFVRHALLAEPAFLDLHWRREMANSTFPCPIGIDSSLCLLSQHTWRRILPRPIGIDSPLCLLSQHTWRRILPRRCHLDRRRGGCCPATATGANLCEPPPCSPAPRAPELLSSVSIQCRVSSASIRLRDDCFFLRFEIRGLFDQLSPESQLIRSGLYPFRINPK